MDIQTPSINLEYLFLQVYKLLTGSRAVDVNLISESAATFWFYFQIVAYAVSALLIIGIIYCIVRIQQIRTAEAPLYQPPKKGVGHSADALAPTVEERKNEKWRQIEALSSSENPSDWRLAILEADIILDEIVTRMGYKGDTFSEKLKQVEASDFQTLEQAWEAHKVRNRIAHTGSDFILTRRETLRVIDLFRQVFEEFHYI